MDLKKLNKIIMDRKLKKPEGSYVASLFQKGVDRIIQKVGEEAIEVVIASKNGDKKKIVGETADLVFHLMVLLAALGIKIEDIEKELDNRSC